MRREERNAAEPRGRWIRRRAGGEARAAIAGIVLVLLLSYLTLMLLAARDAAYPADPGDVPFLVAFALFWMVGIGMVGVVVAAIGAAIWREAFWTRSLLFLSAIPCYLLLLYPLTLTAPYLDILQHWSDYEATIAAAPLVDGFRIVKLDERESEDGTTFYLLYDQRGRSVLGGMARPVPDVFTPVNAWELENACIGRSEHLWGHLYRCSI